MRRSWACALLLGLGAVAHAQTPVDPGALHAEIASVYAVVPHRLDEAGQKAAAERMDGFWKKLSADPAHGVPALRMELQRTDQPAFFYYDGAHLLARLSTDKDSLAVALNAIGRAPLEDVDAADYVDFVRFFSAHGLDAHAAAMRILDEKTFKVSVPQHALMLGKDYALVSMLYVQPEDTFVPAVVERLAKERDADSAKALLLAAWYSATPAADTALRQVADDAKADAAVRAYARELLARQVEQASGAGASIDSIRAERRTQMAEPISDESLEAFDRLTVALLQAGRTRAQ